MNLRLRAMLYVLKVFTPAILTILAAVISSFYFNSLVTLMILVTIMVGYLAYLIYDDRLKQLQSQEE